MRFQEPRPTYFCQVCQRMLRHLPVPHDTAHCECRYDGPLPCECDCHLETLAPSPVDSSVQECFALGITS